MEAERRKLKVSKGTGCSSERLVFVIEAEGRDQRYVLDKEVHSRAITGIKHAPVSYRLEHATAPGVTNVFSGVFNEWSKSSQPDFVLPIAFRTAELEMHATTNEAKSGRNCILVLANPSGIVTAGYFEHPQPNRVTRLQIPVKPDARILNGLLACFSGDGRFLRARPVVVSDVGLRVFSVKVQEQEAKYSDEVNKLFSLRLRHLLEVNDDKTLGQLFSLYDDDVQLHVSKVFKLTTGSLRPKELMDWCHFQNNLTLPKLRANFALLYAASRLVKSDSPGLLKDAAAELKACLTPSLDGRKRALVLQLVRESILRASKNNHLQDGPAILATEFPQALDSADDGRPFFLVARAFEKRNNELNLIQAAKWYSRAHGRDYLDATVRLGELYEHGRGVAPDPAMAESLYRKAADSGHAWGELNLGLVLVRRGDQHLDAGKQLIKKAAVSGFAAAQLEYGKLLEGRMFAGQPDYQNGFLWLRKAADQGITSAMVRLGVHFRDGLGRPSELLEASKWFQRAADLGDADGRYCIGMMHEAGQIGDEPNLQEAEKLYVAAAFQGHNKALRRALRFRAAHLREKAAEAAKTAGDNSALLRDVAMGYVVARSFERSVELAKLIPNADTRGDTLKDVALAMATDGDVDGGLAIANGIDKANIRGQAISEIASSRAKKGDFARALTIADAIQGPFRESALAGIFYAHLDNQDFDACLATIKRMTFAPQAAQVNAARSFALQRYIAETAKAGLFDKAKQAIQLVHAQDGITKQVATDSLIRCYLKADDWQAALALAKAAKPAQDRDRKLVRIAWARQQSGSLSEAKSIANDIQSSDEKGRAFGGMARRLIDEGKLDVAVETARPAPRSSGRETSLLLVAEAYAKKSDFSKALQVAAFIEDPIWRQATLGTIAVLQAKADKLVDALVTAKQMDEQFTDSLSFHSSTGSLGVSKSGALSVIAERQLKSTGVAKSLETLRLIENEDSRRVELFRLAHERARAGDLTACFQITEALPQYRNREMHTNQTLVEAYAFAGQIAKAKQLAGNLTAGEVRSKALFEVVQAQIKAGDLSGAQVTTSGIIDTQHTFGLFKSGALHAIAEAYTKKGELGSAVQVGLQIPSENKRREVLYEVRSEIAKRAIALAAQDDLKQAFDIASVSGTSDAVVSTLTSLARTLVRNEQQLAAWEALLAAATTATTLVDKKDAVSALVNTANSMEMTATSLEHTE